MFLQRARDDDMNDDPLLDDFKILRRRVFQWQGELLRTRMNSSSVYSLHPVIRLQDVGNTYSHLPVLHHGRQSNEKATGCT